MKNLENRQLNDKITRNKQSEWLSDSYLDKTQSSIESIREKEAQEEQNDFEQMNKKVKDYFESIKPDNSREILTHIEYMVRENVLVKAKLIDFHIYKDGKHKEHVSYLGLDHAKEELDEYFKNNSAPSYQSPIDIRNLDFSTSLTWTETPRLKEVSDMFSEYSDDFQIVMRGSWKSNEKYAVMYKGKQLWSIKGTYQQPWSIRKEISEKDVKQFIKEHLFN